MATSSNTILFILKVVFFPFLQERDITLRHLLTMRKDEFTKVVLI